jgi:hypothetical protein
LRPTRRVATRSLRTAAAASCRPLAFSIRRPAAQAGWGSTWTSPPAAQAPFVEGVLYLHSFEYGAAAAAFRRAQGLAPDFAMAYWGEAMTCNHPVWNARDRACAMAALERLAPTRAARRERASTARAALDAVEVLWEDGPKPVRDSAYTRAMEALAAAYPDDLEAQAFFALSLLGLRQGVRDVPTYMQAGAIAQEVFRRNPDHPGAAHYIIHAFDDPTHAPLGLHAARAYVGIAPGAAHAQHITTHIFLSLGMWDDVVRQNEVASGDQHAHYRPGHYTTWLAYGYPQQGRFPTHGTCRDPARQPDLRPGRREPHRALRHRHRALGQPRGIGTRCGAVRGGRVCVRHVRRRAGRPAARRPGRGRACPQRAGAGGRARGAPGGYG